MAASLAELIIISLIVDFAFKKFRLPGLIGMLLVGVLFGPYVLNWLSPEMLTISQDLRSIALLVILLRAGLELSKSTLFRVGKTALLLSCIPAILEGAVITILGPPLLGLTYKESAIIGAILGAVSPAVVVPLMVGFIKRRMGAVKGIPTLILAASSIDDVFVIVVYSVLIGMYTGENVNIVWDLAGIPISIILGVVVGGAIGFILFKLFDRFNPRATKRLLVLLGVSILLFHCEHLLKGFLPFAALLSVMAIGFVILDKRESYAHEISAKLGKLWIFAEILLFTLVGAQVDIGVAWQCGLNGALLVAAGLVARCVGSYLCVLGAGFNGKEKLFIVISYLPKATVQAAIGAAPLAAMKANGMATGPGEVILAVAVLSILLTAPLGAWAIMHTGEKFLETAPPEFTSDAARAAEESEAA